MHQFRVRGRAIKCSGGGGGLFYARSPADFHLLVPRVRSEPTRTYVPRERCTGGVIRIVLFRVRERASRASLTRTAQNEGTVAQLSSRVEAGSSYSRSRDRRVVKKASSPLCNPRISFLSFSTVSYVRSEGAAREFCAANRPRLRADDAERFARSPRRFIEFLRALHFSLLFPSLRLLKFHLRRMIFYTSRASRRYRRPWLVRAAPATSWWTQPQQRPQPQPQPRSWRLLASASKVG